LEVCWHMCTAWVLDDGCGCGWERTRKPSEKDARTGRLRGCTGACADRTLGTGWRSRQADRSRDARDRERDRMHQMRGGMQEVVIEWWKGKEGQMRRKLGV
jgi:hypothetical protein